MTQKTQNKRNAITIIIIGCCLGFKKSFLCSLDVYELRIDAIAVQQLLVSALLSHDAFLQHHDVVCILHGRQAMGDHDGGVATLLATLHQQLVQSQLHR